MQSLVYSRFLTGSRGSWDVETSAGRYTVACTAEKVDKLELDALSDGTSSEETEDLDKDTSEPYSPSSQVERLLDEDSESSEDEQEHDAAASPVVLEDKEVAADATEEVYANATEGTGAQQQMELGPASLSAGNDTPAADAPCPANAAESEPQTANGNLQPETLAIDEQDKLQV